MTEPCEHRVQYPYYDPGAEKPWQYYCRRCGDTLTRESEPSPIWGIPYVRARGDGQWMGLGRTEHKEAE